MKTRKQVKVLLIVLIGIFIPYPQKAHSQNYVPMKDDTKMGGQTEDRNQSLFFPPKTNPFVRQSV